MIIYFNKFLKVSLSLKPKIGIFLYTLALLKLTDLNNSLLILNPNKSGRGEVIRTLDPLFPKQVRYQAALRPGPSASISGIRSACPYSIGKKMSAA
mgnify:CR=1 FL=1